MKSKFLAIAALALFCGFRPAAAGEPIVVYKSISPEVAIEAVQAAIRKCRADGFQVAAVVVDRFGQAQALMRDQYAGLPANQTATDKAYTALSFRSDTSALGELVKSGQLSARISMQPHILMVGGGVIIESGGTLMGAIGVSGAPSGDRDEACAKAALETVHERIDF